MSNDVLIFGEYSTAHFLMEVCRQYSLNPIVIFPKEYRVDYLYQVFDFTQTPADFCTWLKARSFNPTGIINCSEELVEFTHQTYKLLFDNQNTRHSVDCFRNKHLMKQIWLEHHISTPVNIDNTSPESISFPVIVKPKTGAASAGVTLAHNVAELKQAIRSIKLFNATLGKNLASNQGVLVETYIDGPEYCIDQFWRNGEPFLSVTMSKSKPESGNFMDRLYYVDPNISPQLQHTLVHSATHAVQALGVIHGITHTEMRINTSTNEPYLIETAFRPGAGCGIYPTYRTGYDVDIFRAAVAACLPSVELPQMESIPKPATSAFWYNLGYTASGRIRSISTDSKFSETFPFVTDIIWRKQPGDYLPKEGNTFGYLGWILGVLPDNFDPCQPLRFEDHITIEVEH